MGAVRVGNEAFFSNPKQSVKDLRFGFEDVCFVFSFWIVYLKACVHDVHDVHAFRYMHTNHNLKHETPIRMFYGVGNDKQKANGYTMYNEVLLGWELWLKSKYYNIKG